MSEGTRTSLVVSSVTLRNLRNVVAIDLELHERLNLIVGANGQGKTTVLEGIYLLGATRSFRGSRPVELVRHGERDARVRGQLRRGRQAESSLAVSLGGCATRRVEVDGKRADLSIHFRMFPMVVFHPGDLDLVSGGPAVRRRFLDRMLFQAEAGYASWHRDYRRALQSRNELLRSNGSSNQIHAFDGMIASLGSSIGQARKRMTAALEKATKRILGELSGPDFDIVLESCVDPEEDAILLELGKGLSADRRRGRTSVGPHTDDLWIGRKEGRARAVASRGEARVLTVALRLAQLEVVGQGAEAVPLLLLDDVAAELDRARTAKVVSMVSEQVGQVVVTATGATEGEFGQGWRRVELNAGAVVNITDS